jgi:protein-disulfide isomerase
MSTRNSGQRTAPPGTDTKPWPVNPPPGARSGRPGGGPGDSYPDPGAIAEPGEAGAAARVAAARATAHRRRGLRGGAEDPDALRHSPILWISVIALAILILSGLIVWRGLRYPPPPGLATPAGVTDDGGTQAGIAVAGTGPTTVEVYVDLLCSQCRTVDAQTRPLLDQLAQQNRIRLVWHPLGFLDDRTDPPGYSTRAANALACAADAGKLRPYADVLFAHQPAANRAGLSDDQLIDVAGPAGLNAPAFAACVRDQRYRDWVAIGDSMATRRGVSQAPAIFVDGTRLERPTPQAILMAIG